MSSTITASCLWNTFGRALKTFDVLRMVSAYFSIYGYELLEEELRGIERVRFLFGDPDSVADLDPGTQETKAFGITENGLSPKHRLEQKHLARRCADWVARRRRGSPFCDPPRIPARKDVPRLRSRTGARQWVGSSNFTRRGLGGGNDPNLEINLAIGEESENEWLDLKGWFEEVWGDKRRTQDVKADVLQGARKGWARTMLPN